MLNQPINSRKLYFLFASNVHVITLPPFPITAFRFADHLKNTEYKWPFWKHWCNVVELPPDNAQRLFVSNVLAALVKLSYTDRYSQRQLCLRCILCVSHYRLMHMYYYFFHVPGICLHFDCGGIVDGHVDVRLVNTWVAGCSPREK